MSDREHLLIRGRLTRDDDFVPRRCGSTTFVRTWPEGEQPDHGDIVIETLDDDGNVLREERPSITPEGVCAGGPPTWRVRGYVALDDHARIVRMRRGARTLYVAKIPEEPPRVHVELASPPHRGEPGGKARSRRRDHTPGYPGGDPAVLSLELSRPAEPDVAYVKVVYRWGEHRFHTVHAGPADSKITIDADRLPGGEQCDFLVAYSDGVRSAIARTEPIDLPPIGPVLTLVEPAPGATFSEGTPIQLDGSVVDPERPTARVDDASIRWLLDGEQVAEGMRASIDPLPAGEHLVEMVYAGVDDREPVSAAATIVVREAATVPADDVDPFDPFQP